MEFYVIPPNNHLELMHQGQRYFCLAQHYIANKEYRDFFKARVAEGKWVTLDNGAGDFALITEDILLDCVKSLRPSEVIPPDVIFDKETTLKNYYSFIERLRNEDLLDKVEIFACPQGTTKEDWIECYKTFLADPLVKTIGLSKIAVPFAFLGKKDDEGIAEARNLCYAFLKENNLLQKPLHCLGMGSPKEFLFYENESYIRSTDSCYSCLSAINGFDWTKEQFTRIKTPHDYFERTMSQEQIALAKSNADWFRNLLGIKEEQLIK